MKRHPIPQDPRGGHVRLYNALIDSPAWNALSATDQRAYVALRRSLRASNNGDLSLPLSRARHYGITSPATLAKSLRALAAVGVTAVTRRGGCTRGGQRLPTLYRVTDEQVYEMKPKLIDACKASDDWKNIGSISQGKAAIAAAEERARKIAAEKRLLQKLNGTRSGNDPVKAKTGSETEAWRPAPVRKLKRGRQTNIDPSASNGAGPGRVGVIKA